MAIFARGVGGARALTPEEQAAQNEQDRLTSQGIYLGAIPGLNARMAQDPSLGVDAGLLATGRDTSPLKGGVTEGIARLLSGLAGGQFQAKDMAPYQAAERLGTWKYDQAYQGQQAQDAIDRANEHAERMQLLGAMTGQRTTAPGTSVINPNATTPTPPGLTPDQAAPLQAASTVSRAFNNAPGAPGVPAPNNVAMLGPQGGPLGAGPALPPQQGAAPAPSALPVNPTVSPASSGAAPTASTSPRVLQPGQTARAPLLDDRVVNFFLNKGYSQAQARGIAAGVYAESSNNPNAFNSAGGGSGAMGLGQWRGSRQDALKQQYGANPTFDQQLEHIHSELQGGDPGGKAVLAANDEQGVLNAYVHNYMRPGERGARGDISRGQQALGSSGAGSTVSGGGGPAGTAPINIPTPPTVAQPALVAPPEMPAEIPLPERIKSTRLGIADRLLSGTSYGDSPLAYMMAQPLIEQGLTEDQASKQSAYDAAVKSIQARQAAGLQLYNAEHEAQYAARVGDYTAARQQQYALQSQQYGAGITGAEVNQAGQIATQAATAKAAADATAARIKAEADEHDAQIKADAAQYKVPNATRVRWGNNIASLNAIDEAIREVNARPQSFNVTYGAMGNDAANKLDPDGARARAAVQRVASQVEVAAGGTRAMAPGEQAIFARYQPTKYSNARTVLDLLRSHRSYIDSENKSYEFAYGKNRFAAPDAPYMILGGQPGTLPPAGGTDPHRSTW